MTAWREEDAGAVNTHVVRLASLLPAISPAFYPSPGRLQMESWYFRYKSMTWVWLAYLAGVIPLLMSVIYKWDRARTLGMALFVVAFALHTASVVIRWYISGRWPNANMFEAVTTAAWFGGVGAMALEWFARRSALRNLFALGSAVMSMLALMAAYFLPAQLDSTIQNKMAALHDVWLYIHTNKIIWSYAVIALACVPALLLLRDRWCVHWDRRTIPKGRLLVLPIALGLCNFSAYRLLMHVIDHAQHGLPEHVLAGTAGVFLVSLALIAYELAKAGERRAPGGGVERSAQRWRRVDDDGATRARRISSTGSADGRSGSSTAGRWFWSSWRSIMLWTGTVMGAIWADHSWGRPWGWDPKEVFALNTFIIFLILIHVRIRTFDKAFWTAILAVVGFEVMMFNWIVVYFVISGLHSYA